MYSFPVEAGESIVKKSLVSLQYDGGAFSGALYLTTHRLVFVGYILAATRKYMEDIPLTHISAMTRGKSLFMIPNVLNVRTIEDKKLKFIVSGSGKWLFEINKQKQAQVISATI